MNRIPESTIERILAGTDLIEVIRSYDSNIKKAGQNYKAVCPFHDDKDPSLVISPSKQIYKCFSCGAGGNAISFVMNRESVSYPEAIKILANRIGEQVEEFELTGKDKEEYELKNDCKRALKEAALFYHQKLKLPENKIYLDYALTRMSIEAIDEQLIGYAGSGIRLYLNEKGFSNNVINKAGIIKIKDDGEITDYFYKRVVFPIRDVVGNIVAFTGRSLEEKKGYAKYKNSPEAIVYNKSSILYGLDIAKKAIVKEDKCFIVEGNMDVLTLQDIGITNVVAMSGTVLTEIQIKQLTKYTTNIYIIADTDDAGMKALDTNAQKLIQNKFIVYYVPLPEVIDENGKSVKYDADSFFKGKEKKYFTDYIETSTKDYILWLAEKELTHQDIAAAEKGKKIKSITRLFATYGEVLASTYIDKLGNICPKRITWEKAYTEEKKIRKQQETERKNEVGNKEKEDINPEQTMIDEMANRNFLSTVLSSGVDKNFFIKYGFYFRDNRYFFQIRNKNGKVNQFYHGSNFVLYPIAHITTGKESKNDSRRIYKMVNIFNHEVTINLSTEEGIGLKSFMKVVESCGNFMFTGDENNLKELRESLNNETKTYLEIEQLGWQKRGSFWAYGNGIMDNNKFHPVDEYGLIEVANNKYYLPAFSKLNIDDDSLFLDQKRFIHSEREYKPTFKEITEMFVNLYGENAKVIICAYLGVLFKDVIKRNEVKYPIINVFGEKGSGKTEFCSNAMFLFGQGIKEKKLDTATLPAIASYVGQFSNAFVHLDEYKNNIGSQKIEYLKGLWDGVGRTKANLEDISKTITSKVDCGILMSGQELCTVDNALLNRTCTITFFKGEFSDEERTLYKSFRDIARDGLTHITNELLLLRENFIECFPNAMQQAMDDLSDMTNNCCETRLVQNWAILLASYKALEDVIDIDLQYNDLIAIFSKKLIEQNKISKSASEVNIFWEAVRICISRHQLRENFDYEVKMVNKVKVDDGLLTFPIPTRVLYLNPSKVFQLYAETQIASRESSIPTKSMKMYLENSSAFIGHKDSKRFKDDSKESGCCVTKAMVFNYHTLNVKLVDSGENNEDDYVDEKENNDTNNVQKVVENGLFDK